MGDLITDCITSGVKLAGVNMGFGMEQEKSLSQQREYNPLQFKGCDQITATD
jgi:hypothetical protein